MRHYLIASLLFLTALTGHAQNRSEAALEGTAAQKLLRALESAGSHVSCDNEEFKICGTVAQDLVCTKEKRKKYQCQLEGSLANGSTSKLTVKEAKASQLYGALAAKVNETCAGTTCSVSASMIQCLNYLSGPNQGFECAILH